MKNRNEVQEVKNRKREASSENCFLSPVPRSLLPSKLWALILSALLLSGCLGSLFPKSPAPDYYQIDYPFQPSNCAKPFSGAVRIWPFGASAPFDREQMIVTSPSLQVRFSSHYKWVNSAGNMVADNLMRDLSHWKGV